MTGLGPPDTRGKPKTGSFLLLLLLGREVCAVRDPENGTSFVENAELGNKSSVSGARVGTSEEALAAYRVALTGQMRAALVKFFATKPGTCKDVNGQIKRLKMHLARGEKLLEDRSDDGKKIMAAMKQLRSGGKGLDECKHLKTIASRYQAYIEKLLEKTTKVTINLAKMQGGFAKYAEKTNCNVNTDATPSALETQFVKDPLCETDECPEQFKVPPAQNAPCSDKGDAKLQAFGSSIWHTCGVYGLRKQVGCKMGQHGNYGVCCCDAKKIQSKPGGTCDETCTSEKAERHRATQYRINAIADEAIGPNCDYGETFKGQHIAAQIRGGMEKTMYQEVLDKHDPALRKLTKEQLEERSNRQLREEAGDLGKAEGNSSLLQTPVPCTSGGCLSAARLKRLGEHIHEMIEHAIGNAVDHHITEKQAKGETISADSLMETEDHIIPFLGGILCLIIVIYWIICFFWCMAWVYDTIAEETKDSYTIVAGAAHIVGGAAMIFPCMVGSFFYGIGYALSNMPVVYIY